MSSFIASLKQGTSMLGAVGLDINIETFKQSAGMAGIQFSSKVYYFILNSKMKLLLHSEFSPKT